MNLREILTKLDNTQRKELAHLIANYSANYDYREKIYFKKFYDDTVQGFQEEKIEVSNMVITTLENIRNDFKNVDQLSLGNIIISLHSYCYDCRITKLGYCGWWCPICQKPNGEKVRVLNFLKVLDYIRYHYPDFKEFSEAKQELWDSTNAGNDSYVKLYLDEKDRGNYSSWTSRLCDLIIKEFAITGDELWFISW